MFKIGEFAHMSGTSINTLYHYDNIGLLKPVKIDEFTGYRYYDASQLVILNKIIALKDAGFSLNEIARLLNSNPTTKSLINILEDKADSLEKTLEKELDKLKRLQTNIFLIKNGGIPIMNEISIKKVEPILVASLRRVFIKNKEVSFDSFCENIWADLNKHIEIMGGKRTIPCMTICHEVTSEKFDMEVIEPITKEIKDSEDVKIYELPSIERMACIIHKGPFSKIEETYKMLFDWVSKNGYVKCGPVREIYHKGEWVTDDPNEYITELQCPIE